MIRSVSSIVLFSILLVGPAQCQETLLSETYSLSIAFGDQHTQANLFHDVQLNVKRNGRLVIRVIEDVRTAEEVSNDKEAEPNTASKSSAFGGGENKLWRYRPRDQQARLTKGTKFYGQIKSDEVIRIGLTSLQGDRLVSFHLIGKPTKNGARGKVYCLSSDGPKFEGRWELHNPKPQALPIGGPSMKGSAFGS
ncbi:MAG: hypothetical protein AAGG48_27145 [Planctomycetota bacterium]